MKALMRFVSVAAVLGTCLFLAGCSTARTARAPEKPVYQFSVVETSPDLALTQQQVADLNQAVTNYLKQQGLDREGDYYIRVNFTPDRTEADAEWAVVRIYSIPTRTFTLLAAYPGSDDYQPYDYYRNGYYNPGYSSFSRYGYYDPFDYNYGGYSRPRHPPRDHAKPDQPDKPGTKPDRPTGTPARWNNTPRESPDRPRGDFPPRTANPERWARDRSENSGSFNRSSRNDGGSSGRSYTPPPDRSFSPPPERASSPPPAPARSEPSPQVKDESSRFAPQTNEK